MDDDYSLSHTRWNCKYHIVFIPKYRRKAIYGTLRKDIGIILSQLCEYIEVEIVEGSMCIDHVRMCIRIPPKLAVSNFWIGMVFNQWVSYGIIWVQTEGKKNYAK